MLYRNHWNILKTADAVKNDPAARAISEELGVMLPTAQLLLNRGCETPADARRFLDKEEEQLHDPFVLGAVFGERMILVQGQIPGCAPHPSILYVNGSVHSVHLRDDVTFSLCQSFNDIGVDVFHVLILNKCHISPQSPEIIVIFQY